MSLLTLLLGTLTAVTAATPAAPQDDEVLTLYVADASTFFPDSKDAALVEALRLVVDRVSELPAEIPDFPALPPEVLGLAAHLLTGEKSIRLRMSDDPQLAFPLYGQITLMEGDAQRARQLAEMLANLGRTAGIPLGEAREDGLFPIELPVPIQVTFGAQGGDVVLSAGKTVDAPIDLTNSGLPAGVAPSLVMKLDLGKLLAMGLPLAAMQDPDGVAELEQMLELTGMQNMVMKMAMGCDGESSHTTLSLTGYGAAMREMGLMPTRGVTARDLALVPTDATWATVATWNPRGSFDLMLSMLRDDLGQAELDEGLEMVTQMTGIHPQRDIVEHLGVSYGAYTSDSTGGGSLLSLVLFCELENSQGLWDTLGRAADRLNAMATEQAKGYVRTKRWEHGGAQLMSLTFPGVPVPFEPTLVVTEQYLLVGLTPQAALGALHQALRDDQGLMANERFRQNLPGDPLGAMTVEFFDSPRHLRSGYGMTSLLCSAISNATRSPTDSDRDAGVILPSFRDLAQGARASVGITRFVDDGVVTHYRGDRSVLVNLTSVVGFVSTSPLLLALPALFLAYSTRQETWSEFTVIEAEIEEAPEELFEDDRDDEDDDDR